MLYDFFGCKSDKMVKSVYTCKSHRKIKTGVQLFEILGSTLTEKTLDTVLV